MRRHLSILAIAALGGRGSSSGGQCSNGGTQIPFIGASGKVQGFSCACAPFNFGPRCEVVDKTNDCLSNPCLNGGTCVDGFHIATCNCAGTGYGGAFCEVAGALVHNPAQPIICKNCSPHGSRHCGTNASSGDCLCTARGACDCVTGYSGNLCNECAADASGSAVNGTCFTCNCNPRGVATSAVGVPNLSCPGAKCACKAGYTGPRCDRCKPQYVGSALAGSCKQCRTGRVYSPSLGCHACASGQIAGKLAGKLAGKVACTACAGGTRPNSAGDKCVARTCAALKLPPGAMATCAQPSGAVGSSCTIRCTSDELTWTGEVTLRCLPSGEWGGEGGDCVKIDRQNLVLIACGLVGLATLFFFGSGGALCCAKRKRGTGIRSADLRSGIQDERMNTAW